MYEKTGKSVVNEINEILQKQAKEIFDDIERTSQSAPYQRWFKEIRQKYTSNRRSYVKKEVKENKPVSEYVEEEDERLIVLRE